VAVRWFIDVTFQHAVIGIAAALPIWSDTCPVSPVLIRFVCSPSGRLRAGLPARLATWSSRRITISVFGKVCMAAYIIGEKLALKRYQHLFTHLLPYDYPDLTLSGGAGVAVLRTARATADRPFR
jgi:hypothetical protein